MMNKQTTKMIAAAIAIILVAAMVLGMTVVFLVK